MVTEIYFIIRKNALFFKNEGKEKIMDDHFYGFPLKSVRINGLRAVLVDTTLQLYDKEGVKYEIRTITSDRLSVYHRSLVGPMHYQKYSDKTTYSGVASLLFRIKEHEIYRKRFHLITKSERKNRLKKIMDESNSFSEKNQNNY
jgi:hypothetical protein